MKTRKLFLLLSVAIMLICSFGLFACANKDNSSGDGYDGHTHVYINYVYNHDATCGKAGTETAKCSYCSQKDTRVSATHPATGNHTYDSKDVCTTCGHEKSSESTMKYNTVTFNAGEGDVSVSEKQFEVDKVMSDLPVPTREGYRFICWYNPILGEFTSVSVMPNVDFTLIAQWEKVVTQYEDDYVLFKPATQGVKNATIYDLYRTDVDKFVYVELTSDDLGGVASVGMENNFTLRTLDSMQYNIKQGYNWAWYQGSFNNPNGAQRFTLRYGSNVQFVTISDGSGVVVQTYLVDIYVRRDYYVSLYKNIYESQPYDSVRVIENDRFSASTPDASEGDFEFDKRVYYNNSTLAYESFVYSTAITKNWNLYQTYKPVTLSVDLDGGVVSGVLLIKPYERFFTLPTATKDGYDFLGWKLSDGTYLTDINGFGGSKYYSKGTAELTISAEFARTKFYYTFENDELRTQKTIPVVTYTDKTNSEIVEILHIPQNTDCALPTKSPNTTRAMFNGWQRYTKNAKGEYYTTPSDFDFNIKVTESIALVPKMSTTSYSDVNTLPINTQTTFDVSTDTFKMYLTAKEEYILKIMPTNRMQITVNAYGKENSKSYTISAGSSYSIKLNYYVYNLGSQVRSKGEVSFKTTSGSGAFTAELVGPTAETVGEPIETTDSLSNAGEVFTFNAQKLGYTLLGWYDGERELTKKPSHTFILPLENITYTTKWILKAEMSNFVFLSTSHSLMITGIKNKELIEIVVPDYVTDIQKDAFNDCNNIIKATIPTIAISSIAKTKLQTVVINGGASIASYAFKSCSSLTSIIIPDSVTSIGNGAFWDCNSLTIYCEAASKPSGWDSNWNYSNCPVVWGCKNNDKDENGYEYAVIDGIRYSLKDGVATVVRQSTNLSGAITIPSSFTYKNASYSVTSIASYAFKSCSSLTSIIIPDSVTSIGSYAFYDCSSLTIYCEAASKPSGWDVSWKYSSRCSVVWDCKNNDKDENGYAYSVIDGLRYSIKDGEATVAEQPRDISGAITIPSIVTYKNSTYSVTDIGNLAFCNCSSLASITIPNSVTSIGASAFYGCSSLTSITIPDSVTSIGRVAFCRCVSLTSIVIPNSVIHMEDYVFGYCEYLTIYCEVASKPSGWYSKWCKLYDDSDTVVPVVWDYKNK